MDRLLEKDCPPVSLNVDNCMIVWMPRWKCAPDDPRWCTIHVIKHPDVERMSVGYHALRVTGGPGNSVENKVNHLLFIQLGCIDDGIDSRDAHYEFMRIKEYREYHERGYLRPVDMPKHIVGTLDE